MKKIIIILLILFTCGCHYTELNDLSIIKSISIDYKDDKYYLSALIIKEINKDNIPTTEVLTVNNESLDKCFIELSNLTNKTIHYSHIDLLIISTNLKDKDIKNIFNYFLKHKEFRNDFLIISSNDYLSLYENTSYDEIEQLLLNNKNPYLINDTIENIIKSYLEKKSFTISYFTYTNDKITYQNNVLYYKNKVERINYES